MSFFNWEDFMRAAAGVAQGELAGRQQAQQEQQANQQQQTQQALQLQQLGQSADEVNFGNRESYLRSLETGVLPKLTGTGATGLLQRLAGERAQIAEERRRAQIARSGLLPAHLRAFFLPQGGGQQQSPYAAGQPGQMPGLTPAGGPQAPAGPPPDWHAPATLPAVTQPQQIDLGALGHYDIKGIDDKQLAAFRTERGRIQKALIDYRGDPLVKQRLSEQLQNLIHDPGDEAELSAAQSLLSQIEGQIVGSGGYTRDEGAVNTGRTRIDKAMEEIRNPQTSPATGAQRLRFVRAYANKLGEQYPNLYDVKGEGPLAGYEEQLKDFDKLSPPQQEERLAEIGRGFKNGIDPAKLGSMVQAEMKLMASVPVAYLNSPEKLAQAAEAYGFKDLAASIKKNGVPVTSRYRAEQELHKELGQAPQMAKLGNVTPYLNRLANLAELAGWTPEQIRQTIPQTLKLAQVPLTAYQEQMLTEHRKDRDATVDYRSHLYNHWTAQENRINSGNKQNGPIFTALMRRNETQIRSAQADLKRILDNRPDITQTQLDAKVPPKDPDVLAAWNKARAVETYTKAWEDAFQNWTGVAPKGKLAGTKQGPTAPVAQARQPKTPAAPKAPPAPAFKPGQVFAPATPAPPARTAAPPPGSPDLSHVSTAELVRIHLAQKAKKGKK